MLQAETAARAEEILSLHVKDLDLEFRRARITTEHDPARLRPDVPVPRRADEAGDLPLESAAGDGHALARTRRAATKEATTRTVSTLQYRNPRALVISRFSAR